MTDSPAIPAWQKERISLLRSAMLAIQDRVRGGAQLLDSVAAVSSSFDGQRLRSRPARRLQASPRTLLRCWYAWKENGTNEAFELRYRPPQRCTTPAFRTWFAKRCLQSGKSVSRMGREVASAWRRGALIPGLPKRRGRERFPVSSPSLHRIVKGTDLILIRRLRTRSAELDRRARTVGTSVVRRALSAGWAS